MIIVRFEQADINDPSLYTENSFDANGNSLPLLLVLGYTQGVQVTVMMMMMIGDDDDDKGDDGGNNDGDGDLHDDCKLGVAYSRVWGSKACPFSLPWTGTIIVPTIIITITIIKSTTIQKWIFNAHFLSRWCPWWTFGVVDIRGLDVRGSGFGV